MSGNLNKWLLKTSLNDCVSKAFNKIIMYNSTDDVGYLKSAYGYLGNAIQIANQEEVAS